MSFHLPLQDRREAGCLLAEELVPWRRQADVIVLALPRGGVPVAAEIARALRVRLDLIVVRKLGVPGNEELAMGAIASGGVEFLNTPVLDALHVSQTAIAEVLQRERRELQRRETAYRGTRPPPLLRGTRVILVDDGLATGSTMRAAIAAVRKQQPDAVIMAVPLGAGGSVAQVGQLVDRVVCPFTPEPFAAIGQWYVEFGPVSDEEVIALLRDAWRQEDARGAT